MFLTLLDHLRLTFGHVVYRQRAHSKIAYARARWSRQLKAAEALLMTGVMITAAGAWAGTSVGKGHEYVIATFLLAGLSLAVLLVHLMFDLDRSARAHASCATQLWRIVERYRAVLSDLADGAIDVDAARIRRDALMDELNAIYEHAPALDYQSYQTAKQLASGDEATLTEATLTDQEIDLFLPKSLQKEEKSATAASYVAGRMKTHDSQLTTQDSRLSTARDIKGEAR
jgi:hypothetical protein